MSENHEPTLLKKDIDSEELLCGIIMPIAEMDEYTESHWKDVKNIIIEAVAQIEEFNFKTSIVSDSPGEMNIIHKNIISNLYNADIVICDISGRNPNVLFELGMRLTFDKPTIIIKDFATPFIFDTSSIETLLYPKDLRFRTIVEFKNKLAERVRLTYEKSQTDSTYSPFLGHFGEFKVPKLDQTTVTDPQQFIISELSSIRDELKNLKKDSTKSGIYDTESDVNPRNSHLKKPANSKTMQRLSMAVIEYLLNSSDKRNSYEIIHSKEFINFISDKNLTVEYANVSIETLSNLIINYQKDLNLFK